MSDVYPLKFQPIYKEKIWGGRNLQRLFGRALPPGKIGESWELADLAEGVSVAANGPAAGRTLTELVGEWAGDLLGDADPPANGRFPLLLDANDTLSLQVHPDERAVAEIGPPAAMKTECWYIVESRGGKIYKGVRPGVTGEEFRRAIEAGNVEKFVRQVDPDSGDFHYLPTGTVHAVGAGLVISEVQTPSDTTYRVTDWGRGREIDVERSMQCIRFDLTDGLAPGAQGETLLVTEYFTVAMGCGSGPGRQRAMPVGRCAALMFVAGRDDIELRHRGPTEPLVLAKPGETVLLPAGLNEPTLAAADDCKFLIITLGKSQ